MLPLVMVKPVAYEVADAGRNTGDPTGVNVTVAAGVAAEAVISCSEYPVITFAPGLTIATPSAVCVGADHEATVIVEPEVATTTEVAGLSTGLMVTTFEVPDAVSDCKFVAVTVNAALNGSAAPFADTSALNGTLQLVVVPATASHVRGRPVGD